MLPRSARVSWNSVGFSKWNTPKRDLNPNYCTCHWSDIFNAPNQGILFLFFWWLGVNFSQFALNWDSIFHEIRSCSTIVFTFFPQCLAESERNDYELQALHDSLDELRKSLDKSNLTSLRNHVLVHVQHIQSGLCNFDNHMTPFNGTDTNAPTVISTRNLPLPNDNDNH